MMTAEQLKNSILQMALQGKLVEQRTEEGTGKELLKQISKCFEVAKEFSVDENESPFEIPTSWAWTKVGNITILYNGRAFKPSDWTEEGLPIVRIQNLNDINASYNKYSGSYEEVYHLYGGELLFAWSGTPGTSFGAHIWREEEAVLNQHIFKIDFPENQINKQYFALALNYQVLRLIHLAHGSAGLQHVTKGVFQNTLIPLPPLAEQKRIVAKIEEIMPFVEQYATASTKLNTLNTSFPEMMKKSILQEAVQGKLVPQDPNDEPASVLLEKIAEEKKRLIKEGKIKKQKPLPEITEDEIPFDIPESWEWVRVGSYFNTSSGTTPSKSNNAYYDQKDFNWVRTTDLNNGILDKCEIQVSQKAYEECRLEIIPQDSVCIAMYGGGGTIGKNALIKFDTTINQSVCAIHPNGCNMKYIQLFMQHIRPRWMDFASGSRKDPNINQIIIKNCLVPIPPLKEQERIVENVTRLLGRIEQM